MQEGNYLVFTCLFLISHLIMYVWNYYGHVPVIGIVVGSIVVGVVGWLIVHVDCFNAGLVFMFKLLL